MLTFTSNPNVILAHQVISLFAGEKIIYTQSDTPVRQTHRIIDIIHRIIFLALFTSLCLILLLAALPALGAASLDPLSSASGPAGTSVGFSGSGYTPNASYSVFFASGTSYATNIYSHNVAANGTVAGFFTVPQIPGGTYNVTVNATGDSPVTFFTITQAVSINTNSYRVGDPLTITGTGFMASTSVTVQFDGVNITSTASNGNGSFSAAFNVPPSRFGVHTVTARDGVYSQFANLNVISSMTSSPTVVHVGDTETIVGTGFAASSTVNILFDGVIVTAPTSDGNGSFSATFNVPPGQAGAHSLIAGDGSNSLSGVLTVVPSMMMSPTTPHVGDAVTITGNGFAASRTVNIRFDGVTINSTSSDVNGSFSASFIVPSSQSGAHGIIVSDGVYGLPATLTVTLSLAVSPATAHVGDTVTISGKGFAASRTVNIQIEGVIITSTASDSYGSFSTVFNVPPSQAGVHSVTAVDGINNQSVILTVTPSMIMSPTTVHVGDTVTISGTGFRGSGTVNIQFDGVTVTFTTSDGSGSFSTTFNVPPSQVGAHGVTAVGGVNSQSIALTVIPSMTMGPTTVHVGDLVTVAGKGFGGGRTVNTQFDGTSVNSTTSSPDGSFTAIFKVPAGQTGTHTVTAGDGINNQSLNLSITPFISINPVTVHVGDPVTVTGTGFGANRSFNIQVNGTTVTLINSNTNGTFTVIFTTPVSQTGTYVVTAGDGLVSQSASLVITQFITINPATVHVGDPITVSGTGYGVSRTINLQFDGTTVISANSSPNGTFTAIFNTPAAQTGTHMVTAGDGLISQTANLSVVPFLETSTVSAHVGDQVEIAGTGFTSAKNIIVQYANTNVATIPTDTYGSFIGVFKIPASQAGTNLIKAGDGQNNLFVNVSVISLITLGPTSGIPGSIVTVSGTGFNSNRSMSIAFSDTAVSTTPSTIITDNSGSFSGNFTVPWLDVNSYKVAAIDGTNTATAVFALIARFDINPHSGKVGSNVTVNGSGFSGLITVKYDNQVVASVASGTNGSISTTFAVPVSVHGSHNITLNDAFITLQTGFVMESVLTPAPVSAPFVKGPKQGLQPTFAWQSVSNPSGLTYTLQIGTDATFSNVTLEKAGLTSLNYTLTDIEKLASTKPSSPYYWRVRAVDLASNEGDWSQPIPFSASFLPDWAPYALIVLGSAAAVLGILGLGFKMGRRP